jgi:MFS family permease
MTFIASNIVYSFFSLYLNAKGLAPFELGIVISLMSYTTLFIRIPFGMITSRIGIRWVVPLALIGQSTAYIFYSLVSNPIQFYVIRVFHAVTLASLQPTLMSIISAIAPSGRKGEAVGTYLTSVGLAMIGGSLISSLLLSFFNYNTILILSSLMPILSLGIYLSLLKTEILGNNFSEAPVSEVEQNPFNNLREIVSLSPVRGLTYGRFTFAFTMSIISTLYAVYSVNILKIDPSVYALFMTLRGVTNTVARIPTGKVSDAIGRKKPLQVAFILLTLVFILLSEVRNPVSIGFVMLLYGVSHGIRAVSEWSLMADTVTIRNRSLANFYFTSVFDLGSALGATFAGTFATIISTPTMLQIASLIIGSSILVISNTHIPKKSTNK